MKIDDIPFEVTDWSQVEPVAHAGTTGQATWRTRQCGAVRVRMVDYSPGYLADHWCEKGHILLCLDGRMDTELSDGRVVTLTAGMSYQVADGASSHRTRSEGGAKLFIVD
jgi:hypothetical protein